MFFFYFKENAGKKDVVQCHVMVGAVALIPLHLLNACRHLALELHVPIEEKKSPPPRIFLISIKTKSRLHCGFLYDNGTRVAPQIEIENF